MNVKEIIEHVNNLADDLLPSSEVLGYVNDAIAAINIEVDADYPLIEPYGFEYVEIDLPEKWIRMLIIPYVKGRIKEKDSSQFEWESGYEQFFTNMHEFAAKYKIPEKYKAQDNNPAGNMLNNVPFGWGGW